MGKSSRRQFRSETVARLRQIQEGGWEAPPEPERKKSKLDDGNVIDV